MAKHRPVQGQCPCPPRDSRRYLPLVKVIPGKVETVAVWSQEVYACQLRWTGERTILLTEPVAADSKGFLPPGVQWYGFLVGLLGPYWSPRLVQITQGAWRSSPSLQATNGQLRGRKLTLSRLGRSPNAPLRAVVEEEGRRQTFPALPECPEAVGRLFGVAL